MRIDVKKFIFIGLADLARKREKSGQEKSHFFSTMQRLGIIHFIDVQPKIPSQLPQDIADLASAIKIVLNQPTSHIQEDYQGQVDELSRNILALKDKIERFYEEQKVLQLEIKRINPFGDFNFDDIAYIEKEGQRKFRFFCAKLGSVHRQLSPELIYINSDHGLDYFVAIQKEAKSDEGFTRISHTISSKAGRDIHPDSLTIAREHCPTDKARAIESEDGWIDPSVPRVCEKSGFTEMHFDRSLSELKERSYEIEKKIHEEEAILKTYAKYHAYMHHALIDKYNYLHLEKTTHFSREILHNSLFVVEGWIPVDKIDEVKKSLKDFPVYMEEIAIEERDEIPTYLENHGAGRIGEDLIHIYDTPSHTDRDPSLWVFFAFSLFFAMIIGDAGYGLIFLSVAIFLRYYFRNAEGARKRLLKLTVILSCATVVWGVLTHSFFGISPGIDHPLRKVSLLHWLIEKKAEHHFSHKDAEYQEWERQYPEQVQKATNGEEFLRAVTEESHGKLSYLMLESFSKSIMLEIALVIGIVHIILSFLRYLDRRWSGFGWILFLLGAYLYFPSYLGVTSMLYYAFGVPPSIEAREGMILMIGGFSLMLFLSLLQNKWYGFLEINNVIQIFADVLSYLRLYALALAGAIMSQVINEIAAAAPIVIAIVLIIASHAINMALGIMGGIIHGLRLNFLEWYHYSFEGGGKLFRPLTLIKTDNTGGKR